MQNNHATHIEDLIFFDANFYAKKICDFVTQLIANTTVSDTRYNIFTPLVSRKIDGSPSIFAGWDNGKFFVASKSIFNKTQKSRLDWKDDF